MKKWSETINKINESVESNTPIQDILNGELLIESNEDYTDLDLKIIGQKKAEEKLNNLIKEEIINENLKLLQEIENNFRVGNNAIIEQKKDYLLSLKNKQNASEA
jgi:hypothetical protein